MVRMTIGIRTRRQAGFSFGRAAFGDFSMLVLLVLLTPILGILSHDFFLVFVRP